MGTLFTPGGGPLSMLGDSTLFMPGDSVSFTIGERVSSMPISEDVVMLGEGALFMIGEGRGLTSIPVKSCNQLASVDGIFAFNGMS